MRRPRSQGIAHSGWSKASGIYKEIREENQEEIDEVFESSRHEGESEAIQEEGSSIDFLNTKSVR
jgi:hypothetical protein